MTPLQKAEDLVNQFKNILMDEDTDCGYEVLCTSIAIKNALICADEVLSRVPYKDKVIATDDLAIEYWIQVKKELRQM
jgi:hypothetical protein